MSSQTQLLRPLAEEVNEDDFLAGGVGDISQIHPQVNELLDDTNLDDIDCCPNEDEEDEQATIDRMKKMIEKRSMN
jgi:hypothetical protein